MNFSHTTDVRTMNNMKVVSLTAKGLYNGFIT